MSALKDCPVLEKSWRQETPANGILANGVLANGAARATIKSQEVRHWQKTVDDVVALKDLGDEWDGPGTCGPSEELIRSALGLVYLLQENGMRAPDSAVSGFTGAILLIWQEPDGTYLEVEIVRPFHAEVMRVPPGQPAEHWTLPTQ